MTSTPAAQVGRTNEDTAAAWALVDAARAGDRGAFGKLYERYADVVFRYILFRVGHRELAEDLTSETFCKALRRINTVTRRDAKDPGAWFVTIARNLVFDHTKSSRYRLEITTAEILDADVDDRGPEHEVITTAAATELLSYVAQLGPDQQECITLRFLLGFSVAQTATALARNEGAVKALQFRAVRKLAQLVPDDLR